MRKVILFFFMISLVFLGLYGCGSSSSSEGAKQVAQQFIKTKYQVDDYEKLPDIYKKVENYLTPDELKRFKANREGSKAPDVAKDLKLNIEVKNISLKESKKEKNNVLYDYETTIIFKDEDGKEVYSIHKVGQIKLVNRDGKWLIDNDWSKTEKIPNTMHVL